MYPLFTFEWKFIDFLWKIFRHRECLAFRRTPRIASALSRHSALSGACPSWATGLGHNLRNSRPALLRESQGLNLVLLLTILPIWQNGQEKSENCVKKQQRTSLPSDWVSEKAKESSQEVLPFSHEYWNTLKSGQIAISVVGNVFREIATIWAHLPGNVSLNYRRQTNIKSSPD